MIAGVLGVSQAVAKVNTAFTPEQLPVEYLRGVDPEISCHGKIEEGCLRGNLSTDREVLVLGDSHGNQLNLFFDYIGSKLDFRARVITGSSCVTIPGFDYKRLPEWAQSACVDQIEQGQAHQQNAETIFLVGKWDYHVQSDAFISAIERYLKKMENINKSVVILSQIPKLTQSAMRARRFDKIGLKSYMVLDPSYSSANLQLEAIAEKYSNVTYMALDSLPVFKDAPFWKGEMIYRDKHHINELGAKIYAEYALPYFQYILNNK